MAEKKLQRKLVLIGYDNEELILGKRVSVQTEIGIEILNLLNDGDFQVTFPDSYTGPCTLHIRGSKAGDDTAEFTVD